MTNLVTSTITMPPEEAADALSAYRASLSTRYDSEYADAVMAYEQLVKGTPLISVQDVFSRLDPENAEHFDVLGRPKMAVARADRKQVRFDALRNGTRYAFDTHKDPSQWAVISNELRLGISGQIGQDVPNGFALVPMIPAPVRKRMKKRKQGQDKAHFILWEVDEWSDRSLTAVPPQDPWLLLPIGTPGQTDLYAVVDAWDLTEVERYVMRSRQQNS